MSCSISATLAHLTLLIYDSYAQSRLSTVKVHDVYNASFKLHELSPALTGLS